MSLSREERNYLIEEQIRIEEQLRIMLFSDLNDSDSDLDDSENSNYKRHKYKFLHQTTEEFHDCHICLETHNIFKFCKTGCGHFFCKQCINKWKEKSNLCPLCRTNYPEFWIFVKKK
jgi:hypothetical protein